MDIEEYVKQFIENKISEISKEIGHMRSAHTSDVAKRGIQFSGVAVSQLLRKTTELIKQRLFDGVLELSEKFTAFEAVDGDEFWSCVSKTFVDRGSSFYSSQQKSVYTYKAMKGGIDNTLEIAIKRHFDQAVVNYKHGVISQIKELSGEHKLRRKEQSDRPIDHKKLMKGLCILECEEEIKQGTGFFLEGVGIVTCAHVLGSNTKLFFPEKPHEKFSVNIKKRHDIIDLAIVEIEEQIDIVEFIQGKSDDLKQMDDIYISGFPNYRVSDTGVVISSKVAGFRTVASIKRILSDRGIVAGNSGGPVFNNEHKVIGVAVTGSGSFSEEAQTEDHGVIPIEAINLITS